MKWIFRKDQRTTRIGWYNTIGKRFPYYCMILLYWTNDGYKYLGIYFGEGEESVWKINYGKMEIPMDQEFKSVIHITDFT